MLDLFVNYDACPVFAQVLRAAQRDGLELYIVTRDYLRVGSNVHLILHEGAAGDLWIAANIDSNDICVTTEPELIARCLLRGAAALAPDGTIWSQDAFGAAVAAIRERSWPFRGASRAEPAVDPGFFSRRLDQLIATARRRDRVQPPALALTTPGLETPSRGASRTSARDVDDRLTAAR